LESVEVWIDEKGKKVVIKSFFSRVYIDEETEKLNQEYDIWQCDGEMRLSTLAKAQRESLVAQILVLVRTAEDRGISLVGVKKSELEALTKRSDEHWFIGGLIQEGFLREKWVKGDLVVFPTEKLLENQRIPKR